MDPIHRMVARVTEKYRAAKKAHPGLKPDFLKLVSETVREEGYRGEKFQEMVPRVVTAHGQEKKEKRRKRFVKSWRRPA